jgi:hypothetical protein
MDICCLLLVPGSLERIRFGPFREVGFHIIDRFGKRSAVSNARLMNMGLFAILGSQLALKAPPDRDAFCALTNDRLPERRLNSAIRWPLVQSVEPSSERILPLL